MKSDQRAHLSGSQLPLGWHLKLKYYNIRVTKLKIFSILYFSIHNLAWALAHLISVAHKLQSNVFVHWVGGSIPALESTY